MTERRRTRSEVEIEAQLETLPKGSERYVVLAAARDFKIAWVGLGDRLTAVRESGGWRNWGYLSFEAYCRRELQLRSDTANKLTRSYAFLRDHEPQALANRKTHELPALDVVDLFTRARERTSVPSRQIDSIREEVFSSEEGVPTRNQVVKRFREIDPNAFRNPAPTGGVDLRQALLLAERLQSMLEKHRGVSEGAKSGVRRAARELKDLFEASRKKSA